MPSAHRHPPIPFRPAEGDRSWLLAYAEETGQPVNRILRLALAAYREAQTDAEGLSPDYMGSL